MASSKQETLGQIEDRKCCDEGESAISIHGDPRSYDRRIGIWIRFVRSEIEMIEGLHRNVSQDKDHRQ